MTELRKIGAEAAHVAEAGAADVVKGAVRVRKRLPKILTHRHSKRWFIVHGLASLSLLVYLVADHTFGFSMAILGHGIWLWVDDEPDGWVRAELEEVTAQAEEVSA